jgi:type II secretory pathway component GspD/PulD (secretin)
MPAPPEQIRLPVQEPADRRNLEVKSEQDRVSLSANDVPLDTLLGVIAEQHGLNIVAGPQVNQHVSVKLKDVALTDALNVILRANGYAWTRQNNIIFVSKVAPEFKAAPALQGREMRMFVLNYVTATDMDKVVKGLLSPVGQSFATQSVPTDQRRTQEQIVVDDLPEYLQRIEEFIARADRPPRQVVVEAHVLQVELKDESRHGVDLKHLLRVAGSTVTLETAGFAGGTLPAGSMRIDGTDLDGLIDAIKSTTDAKTLASPKVAVVNGQEARIQVGGQIGYRLTTTTQTSTMESVNFLDVGVILRVTPFITDDHQVLMQVRPQVSTGRINPITELPESETTEVDTRILLADNEALVIGGLIQETDVQSQNKLPWLGDVWLIGRLFQRRESNRDRKEIIITLLPRIVDDVPGYREANPCAADQAGTPLFCGPLTRVDRRAWEPQLPDATRRYPSAWPSESQLAPAYVTPSPRQLVPAPVGRPHPARGSVVIHD